MLVVVDFIWVQLLLPFINRQVCLVLDPLMFEISDVNWFTCEKTKLFVLSYDSDEEFCCVHAIDFRIFNSRWSEEEMNVAIGAPKSHIAMHPLKLNSSYAMVKVWLVIPIHSLCLFPCIFLLGRRSSFFLGTFNNKG